VILLRPIVPFCAFDFCEHSHGSVPTVVSSFLRILRVGSCFAAVQRRPQPRRDHRMLGVGRGSRAFQIDGVEGEQQPGLLSMLLVDASSQVVAVDDEVVDSLRLPREDRTAVGVRFGLFPPPSPCRSNALSRQGGLAAVLHSRPLEVAGPFVDGSWAVGQRGKWRVAWSCCWLRLLLPLRSDKLAPSLQEPEEVGVGASCFLASQSWRPEILGTVSPAFDVEEVDSVQPPPSWKRTFVVAAASVAAFVGPAFVLPALAYLPSWKEMTKTSWRCLGLQIVDFVVTNLQRKKILSVA